MNKIDMSEVLKDGRLKMSNQEFVATYFDSILDDLENLSYEDFTTRYDKPCLGARLLFRYTKKDNYKICYKNALILVKCPMTNRQIGQKTGLSSGTINNYKKGYAWMTDDTLEKLEKAIGEKLHRTGNISLKYIKENCIGGAI